MKTVWKVEITEYERGWGQRQDEVKWFKSQSKAETFVHNFNARNKEPTAPDIYWMASSPRKIQLPDEKEFSD